MKKQNKKPIAIKRCGLFDIYPGLSCGDTFKGAPISSGVMWITMGGGECTLKHKGGPVKIVFTADLGGATVLHGPNRSAKINLNALIQAAIESGLLDDKIDFSETK